MGVLDDYEAAHSAFRSGQILDADNAALLRYLHGLSNQNNTNTGTQHRDMIRGLTINNILLQRHMNILQEHITTLNRQNNRIQGWVIALAVAALVGTVVQVWLAFDERNGFANSSITTAAPKEGTESPPGKGKR